MYFGLYKSKLREKNRIAFPAKLRNLTGDILRITNWFDKSIIVLPEKDWERNIYKEMKSLSFLAPDARDLDRFIFGGTFSVELDREGRFVLPAYLKEYAGITKNIIFTGGMWYIQMWDEEIFESFRSINSIQIKEKAKMVFENLKK